MAKKILTFSAPQKDTGENPTSNFLIREFSEDGVQGYEIDQVIFSTAFNRNECYFQVSKLLTYSNKLSKLLADIDHDLSQTGGKYVPASGAGYTKIWSMVTDGAFEVYGTWRAVNPFFVDRRNEFSAPSIELMVDEDDAIVNENGEYYEEFEWVGTAQLAGIMAGSGDARNVSEMKEFDLDLNPREVINLNNMTEEQIKALLSEQTKEFTEALNAVKKEFSTIVSQGQGNMEDVYEWVGSDGKKYKSTYKEMTSYLTELLSDETPSEQATNIMIQAMKAKGFEFIPKKSEVDEIQKTVDKAVDPTKTFADAKGNESELDPKDADKDVENDEKIKQSIYKKLGR